MVIISNNQKTLNGLQTLDVDDLEIDTLQVNTSSILSIASCDSLYCDGILEVEGSSILNGVTCSSCTSSGAISGTTLTGTIQTASQPNITSVGILGSLSVTNGVTASTLTGTIQTASQPNITSVGTQTGGVNIATGQTYKVNGTSVLSSSALGSGVTSSSLTSVGVLSSLTVSGNLTVDTSLLFVNASNNRVGIGTTSPDYTLDVAGGVNVQSGSVYRIGGGIVVSTDTSGVLIPRIVTISGETNINNYCFSRVPLIRLSKSGTFTINVNTSILTGMTTNYANNYSGTMYDSGSGNVTVPVSGYWRVSCFVRFSDTSSNRGIKPTIQGVRWCIGGDNIYWCPDDPSGFYRRCLNWSESNVLTAGQAYNIQMSETGNINEVIFCMEMIST